MKALNTPMMSPLQLNRYFLKGLHFQLNDGYDRDRVSPEHFLPPELEIGVVSAEQDANQPSQWRFEVSVGMPWVAEKEFPYQVETTLVGYFTIRDGYPADQAERLARVNGPAVLYSCAREIVASVTGRCPYPKLVIPTVTFLTPELVATTNELLTDEPKQLTKGGKNGESSNGRERKKQLRGKHHA